MRIAFIPDGVTCCEPTYKELKLFFLRKYNAFLKKVASLPIRNWNNSSSSFFNFSRTCCEPTYKELKLNVTQAKVKKENPGCEPTYKELKQGFGGGHFRRWNRCEPTYKELKQYFINA